MARIGFIGLGIMGSPMAANLARAGHDVHGHDHHAENMDKLAAAGGSAAATVADAVRSAEVVATMLPDSPQVTDAVLGDDGVVATLRADGARGVLYIDFSTISPADRLGPGQGRRRARPLSPAADHRGAVRPDAG